MTKLSIIIPAYNESESIHHIADKLRLVIIDLQNQYDVEVILVDDGSTDDTGNLLREEFKNDMYVNVVSYQPNRGLGWALREGFNHAKGDIIVTTDFDGTYEFSTIPDIINCLNDKNASMAVASPYHPQGAVEGVPAYRLIFSFGASMLYRILVQWNIYTWTSLFRAYRKQVIDEVAFESNDFLCNTELLVKAIHKKHKVVEFPTVLHTRQYGQSSIRIAKVTMAHIQYQMALLSQSRLAVALLVALFSGLMLILRKKFK